MTIPTGSEFFRRPIEPNLQIAVLERARTTAPPEAQALMDMFRAGLCDRDVRTQCLELASAYNPDAARLLSRMYFCDLVMAEISAIQHRWVARCFDQDEVIRRRAQALYVLLEAGSRHWGQHWGDLELRIYAIDFGGEEGRR